MIREVPPRSRTKDHIAEVDGMVTLRPGGTLLPFHGSPPDIFVSTGEGFIDLEEEVLSCGDVKDLPF